MSTFKWTAPESLQSCLGTELNSLANAAFSAQSSAIGNETDLFEYMNLELIIAAQAANRATGATIEVWMATAVDATYEDASNVKFATQFLCAFALDDAALAARRLNLNNVPIPPLNFKLQIRNNTGQAFAASGNTLKFRRHNEQGV